jgi:hypothetical protein
MKVENSCFCSKSCAKDVGEIGTLKQSEKKIGREKFVACGIFNVIAILKRIARNKH